MWFFKDMGANRRPHICKSPPNLPAPRGKPDGKEKVQNTHSLEKPCLPGEGSARTTDTGIK